MKISIIIAVHNIRDYLERCLDSVINQTYANLEIILVEDHSTDGSREICDKYAERDARIIVIHDKSSSLAEARNVGLLAATGDLIGFVDGDDYIEAQMYELMLAAIIEQQAQVAICRYRCVGEGNRHTKLDRQGPSETEETYLFTQVEALDLLVCEDEKIEIRNTVWSKLFAREAINGFLFDNVKKAEDIMYTTRALCQAERIAYLDRILYNYVVDRQDSLMSEKSAADLLEIDVPILREQIAYVHFCGFHESADKAAYSFYRRTLFWFINFQRGRRKALVKQLVPMLRGERQTIKEIYRHPWVKTGDRVRMRVFLFWPRLYYILVKYYDRYVIPVRTKRCYCSTN
ncbi:MAG: glycosyltransferase [Lachnospiraceae bacterium]|jgi:glycosyltransferase involved in cell wall biosynthesis|nr:glycosyltransferase [Lachnospiraceae bacterium]